MAIIPSSEQRIDESCILPHYVCAVVVMLGEAHEYRLRSLLCVVPQCCTFITKQYQGTKEENGNTVITVIGQ